MSEELKFAFHCKKCFKIVSWTGQLKDHPKCSVCGYTPSVQEIKEIQDQTDRIMYSMEKE